jgi:membrane protein
MLKQDRAFKFFSLFIFFVSLILWFRTLGIEADNSENNPVYKLLFSLTEGYRIRSVLANFLLYLIGYLLISVSFVAAREYFKVSLGILLSWGIWGLLCTIYVLVSIPINAFTTSFGLLIIVGFVFFQKKEHISSWKNKFCGFSILFVLSYILITSSGILPGISSSDSYYYIYHYGEVLAQSGRLSFDLVGTFMTWAGITPALLGSFSSLYGFETILVQHYLLVLSMILLIAGELFYSVGEESTYKIKKIVFTIFLIVLCLLLAPMLLILPYQISNTYTMVYLTAFLILGEKYWIKEKEEIYLNILMSVFAAWITLSRPEGFVLMAFVIVCFGQNQNSKKRMLWVCLSSAFFEIAYLMKLFIEQCTAERTVENTRYSLLNTGVISICILSILLFSFLYNTKLMLFFRRITALIMIGILPILSLLYGYFFAKNTLIIDINAIFSNLNYAMWGYLPHFTVIIAMVFLMNGKLNVFRWEIIIGYIFLNFAFNIARNETLVKGYGDSYNRILLSIMPFIIYSIADRLIKDRKTVEYSS